MIFYYVIFPNTTYVVNRPAKTNRQTGENRANSRITFIHSGDWVLAQNITFDFPIWWCRYTVEREAEFVPNHDVNSCGKHVLLSSYFICLANLIIKIKLRLKEISSLAKI